PMIPIKVSIPSIRIRTTFPSLHIFAQALCPRKIPRRRDTMCRRSRSSGRIVFHLGAVVIFVVAAARNTAHSPHGRHGDWYALRAGVGAGDGVVAGCMSGG